MSNLLQLVITVEADDDELLSAVLALHAPTGWAEETLPTGETRAIVHTEIPSHALEVEQAVLGMLPGACIERNEVARTNWVLAWREYFTPVEAGDTFLVVAPWMAEERTRSDRVVIVIEPKMAFGTGHHNTTALCLAVLSELLKKERVSAGMRFLDLGTGSGILGIACAKAGMTGLGLDNDPLSIENAVENCAVNDLLSQGSETVFSIVRGSIEDTEETYDLILANILAAPLIVMAPAIVKRLKKNGVLVLSGLLTVQADKVRPHMKWKVGVSAPLCFRRMDRAFVGLIVPEMFGDLSAKYICEASMSSGVSTYGRRRLVLERMYCALLEHFGPSRWWPAQSPFEVVLGAILTQNTNWTNVEKALFSLKNITDFVPDAFVALDTPALESAIRPAGFFRQKARQSQHPDYA